MFEFRGFEENERRVHGLNWFEGFAGNERRAHGLNGLIDLGGEEDRGGMNEGVDVGVHEIALGGVDEGVNAIDLGGVIEGEQDGAGVEALGGVDGGRAFRGRRIRCQLCGRTVSYVNLARHERTHRVWDPGGGPRPV